MFLFNTVRSTLLTLATCVSVGGVFHLVVTEPARAYEYTTVTPTYGGGFTVQSHGSNGSSYSTATPTYGGGYTINSYGSGGSSTSTVTPTYGGGYTINSY